MDHGADGPDVAGGGLDRDFGGLPAGGAAEGGGLGFGGREAEVAEDEGGVDVGFCGEEGKENVLGFDVSVEDGFPVCGWWGGGVEG